MEAVKTVVGSGSNRSVDAQFEEDGLVKPCVKAVKAAVGCGTNTSADALVEEDKTVNPPDEWHELMSRYGFTSRI